MTTDLKTIISRNDAESVQKLLDSEFQVVQCDCPCAVVAMFSDGEASYAFDSLGINAEAIRALDFSGLDEVELYFSFLSGTPQLLLAFDLLAGSTLDVEEYANRLSIEPAPREQFILDKPGKEALAAWADGAPAPEFLKEWFGKIVLVSDGDQILVTRLVGEDNENWLRFAERVKRLAGSYLVTLESPRADFDKLVSDPTLYNALVQAAAEYGADVEDSLYDDPLLNRAWAAFNEIYDDLKNGR